MSKLRAQIFFLVLIGLLLSNVLLGQKRDTVYMLPSAQIIAERFAGFQAGVKITRIDSSILSEERFSRLSEILSRHSSVFIKSYGVGYAGSSFRGMSANHTGIFWNDIPLASPMLGLADLSLIPVVAGESIEIRHGGGSAAFGSGNAGGSIHLDAKPVFEKKNKLGFNQSLGSFNTYNTMFYNLVSNSNLYSESKILYDKSQNNFSYTDFFTEGFPKKTISNAESNRLSLIQDLYYKTKSNQCFSLHAWYQSGKRNLPPSMSMAESKASEDQQSLRSSLAWKKIFYKSSIKIMSSYLYDHLVYKDPLSRIFSDSYFHTSFSKAEFVHELFERFHMQEGVNFSYSQAYVNDYGMRRNQYLASFYAALEYRNKSGKIKSSIAVRRDYSGLYTCPLTPFLGFESKLFRSISFYTNAGKNFRTPSLNDLYWMPGGNPLLKPESGISGESGFKLESYNISKAFTYSFHASVFYNLVKDWIIWLPAGGIVWSPQNLKTVMGRGVEYNGMLALHRDNYQMRLSGSYTFTVSSNENPNDIYYRKQLIYVPYENANISFLVEYKNFIFSSSESYTGARYVSPDNSGVLPSYLLTNFSAGKKFIKGKYAFRMHFEVNNAWNASYQSVEMIPMPGRSYIMRIGVDIN